MVRFWRKRQGWLVMWALAALMDVSALLPLPIFLFAFASGPAAELVGLPGYGPFLAVYAAASLVASASRRRSERAVAAYRVAGALLATALAYGWSYATLPVGAAPAGPFHFNPAATIIPFAWIAWGWSSDTIASGMEYYNVLDRFRKRAALMAVVVTLALLSLGERASAVNLLLYWNVLLYFATGLTLLYFARQDHVRAEQHRIGEAASGAATRPMTLWLVAGLVALSLAVAHLLSVDALRTAGGRFLALVRPLFDWIWDLLLLLLYPLLYVMSKLMDWLLQALRRPDGAAEPIDFRPGEPPDPLGAEGLQEGLSDTPWLQWLIIGLLAIVLIRWLLSIRRRHEQAQPSDNSDEVRESLGFWRQLWLDLKALWALLVGRVQAPFSAAAQRRQALTAEEEARDPRALFRRLQRWGAALGRGRRSVETPEQYRAELARLHPQGDREIRAVTDLYQRARYGAQAPTQAEVEAGVTAMAALRDAGNDTED